MPQPYAILLIDDEEDILDVLREYFEVTSHLELVTLDVLGIHAAQHIRGMGVDGYDGLHVVTLEGLEDTVGVLFKGVIDAFIVNQRPGIQFILIEIAKLDTSRSEQECNVTQDAIVVINLLWVGACQEPSEIRKPVGESSQTEELPNP